ncbi:MAG: hypothetical protein RMK18_11215 [Armatimonadota bacterium]|nr:hypothetical protein [Armatimonadota bacterium]MCX7778360.1 hypothetical protein [Armatimonadota bacterium]MDW8026417.1 hypothetical protein [Armatimonadota bacterium]
MFQFDRLLVIRFIVGSTLLRFILNYKTFELMSDGAITLSSEFAK